MPFSLQQSTKATGNRKTILVNPLWVNYYDQIWSEIVAVDHWEFFAYKRPRTPHGLLKDRGQKFFDLHLVVPGVFFTREVLFAVLVFKMVDPNVSFEEEEEIRKSFNKVNFSYN